MAIERTKEEIEKVIDILAGQVRECFSGCGLCPMCRKDRLTGIAMDGALNALRWVMGDNDVPIAQVLAGDAKEEAERQEKMRTEKEQGIVIADLFRRSGIGEPKE